MLAGGKLTAAVGAGAGAERPPHADRRLQTCARLALLACKGGVHGGGGKPHWERSRALHRPSLGWDAAAFSTAPPGASTGKIRDSAEPIPAWALPWEGAPRGASGRQPVSLGPHKPGRKCFLQKIVYSAHFRQLIPPPAPGQQLLKTERPGPKGILHSVPEESFLAPAVRPRVGQGATLPAPAPQACRWLTARSPLGHPWSVCSELPAQSLVLCGSALGVGAWRGHQGHRGGRAGSHRLSGCHGGGGCS